MTEEDRYLDGA